MATALVILAAGGGARLGGVAKALLRCGDETFLAAIAATARSTGIVDGVVVVGPPFEVEVGAAARALGLGVVRNDDPGRGMASSVALGFEAIGSSFADAAWLWPVDHPGVRPATLARLLAARGHHLVVKPRFGGRSGHPPLVAREVWPALAGCAGVAGGARAVLARVTSTIAVDVDDRAVVDDVDALR